MNVVFAVYPRWRGEHAGHTNTTRSAQRFIPAGAGNIGEPKPAARAKTVYPRWRGEHTQRTGRRRAFLGLSPLARGTRLPTPAAVARPRFIPAGAGNTSRSRLRGAQKSVYPRWRGEHQLTARSTLTRCGLSPLARGTLDGVGGEM